MEGSTPAVAATARMVVCSKPRAANADRAAPRMARRVPAERGPPCPGTAALVVSADLGSLTGSTYRGRPLLPTIVCQRLLTDSANAPSLDANDCWQMKGLRRCA